MISRRTFLASAASASLALGENRKLKIGVMDGVVKQRSKPEAVAVAKGFGAEGLQVTLGRNAGQDGMLLEDKAIQQRLAEESRRHNLPINATYIDILHVHCLKNDKMATELVARAIEITKNLNVGILMTVFFGKCSVENRAELQYVADAFKDLAPVAEKAKVILGFENLLNARDQATAMDIVASDYFKVYYDVGNSTNRVGVNAPQEIRWLGKERICQFHFKDEGYLGDGPVNFPEVLKAIDEIGFAGHANLETKAPSGDWQADLRRNLDYLNTLRG